MRAPRGRLMGAERGSRLSQIVLNPLCPRVRASEHAPCDPFNVLKRRHCLAEMVEPQLVRGAFVENERPRVMPP